MIGSDVVQQVLHVFYGGVRIFFELFDALQAVDRCKARQL